jgi:eukaryotic-like serine/threonine-protein kinase
MPIQNRSKVPIGTVLEGKYRITREVGRGGMATVYEALNVDIGKRVAVKVLAAELVTSRIVRERFIREARAAAAIRSPYICDVYDSGMYEERPFLVMELLEGESLYDMMTRVRRLSVPMTLRVTTLTCRGLGRAHEAGVVHRDMKPENIFLIKNEEGETTVKIVDFGLAKFYEQPAGGDPDQVRLTREGALFGTPAYMSPEQAKGQHEVDHRCDIWAMGCIVYECLTGRTVWKVDQGVGMILAQIAGSPPPRPSLYRKDLPEEFDQWFAKTLDRDIAKRFQTAREFSDALEVALANAGQSEGPPSSRPRPADAPAEAPETDPGPQEIALDLPLDQPDETTPSPASPRSAARPAPARFTGSGPAITLLVAATLVALTGYGVWLYVLNPPQAAPGALVDAGPAEAGPASSASAGPMPLEREPYALQIGAAQEWLGRGQMDSALRLFREAFANGGSGVSRSLLTHATVSAEAKGNRCRVTGIGRPRPFDATVPSSRPTLVLTRSGPLVVWVDNYKDVGKYQAASALLDPSLRRVTAPLIVTPESRSVRYPQLYPVGEKLALVYEVQGGGEGGVYVRLLGPDGRIAGQARQIAPTTHAGVDPSLAATGSHSYWLVWEQEVHDGSRDLAAVHLNAELEPIGSLVALTALAPTGTAGTGAAVPSVAVGGSNLYVAYLLERAQDAQVFLLRVPLADPSLQTGVGPAGDDKGKADRKDRTVGVVEPIGKTQGKNSQPRVACTPAGCFVVWDDEKTGAVAAYVDGSKGEKLWHREFAARGSRPSVATSTTGNVVVWYEAGKVKLANIDRDGVGEANSLAHVTGYQPQPEVVAGSKPGQWYVAWRDYEAGHLETFVLRAECQ